MWAEINMQNRRALCKDNDMLRQLWMYISYGRILFGLRTEGNSMKRWCLAGCEGAAKMRRALWMLQHPQPAHWQFFPSRSRQESALWMERVVMKAVINTGAKKEKAETRTMLQIMCSCTNFILWISGIRSVWHETTASRRYSNYFFKP